MDDEDRGFTVASINVPGISKIRVYVTHLGLRGVQDEEAEHGAGAGSEPAGGSEKTVEDEIPHRSEGDEGEHGRDVGRHQQDEQDHPPQ